MRNLKRALSLAMASVMVLGLMVVGTGASYKDVTSEENQEAIEVLQAAGVMVGDDKGNFNPNQNVTRNEMAVIMANLMDYRVASYSGTAPFTDVPSWAEPYVAACYTNGITSGVSATTYGGDQTVTTSQAALMLMKALGYFQYQSDFGDDWQLATVKQATKIDLFVDVESGVREAMTRNDVAQLVLNTLEAGTVEADDDTIKVEADNVTVEAGSIKYNYITSAANYASAISTVGTGSGSAEVSTDGSIVELGEKLYQGALKKSENVTDGFGAPANKWVYNNKEIGTYAKDADYVFEGKVKSEAVYDALGKTAVNYTWDVYVDGDKDTSRNGTLDGSDTLQKQVQDNDSAELKGIGRGATTYIYVNDKDLDGDGTRDYKVTVSVVNVYAAEVSEIKNAGEDDRAVVLNDTVKALEFETSEYEEEDVVLYTKSNTNNTNNNGWTVESIIGLAERVEGEITRVKVQDSIVVDGTTYKYSQTFNTSDYISTDSVNEQVAFYKDTQGNIILLGDVNESNDYAYVSTIGTQSSIYGDGSTFGAKLVLTDGTVLKVTLDDNTIKAADKTANGGDNSGDTSPAEMNYWKDRLVAYTKEDDGTYSLSVRSNKRAAAPSLSIKNGASAIAGLTDQDGNPIYADKNTVFMVCESLTDDDYSIYVGYSNVPDITAASGAQAMAYGKNGIAKVVFMTDVNAVGTGEVVYILGANNDKVIKDANGDFYEFNAVVKGEAVTLQVRDNATNLGTLLAANKGDAVVATSVTYNSKGLVTKVDLASMSLTDGYQVYNGTKRQSSQGLVGFTYVSSTNDYATYLVINDKAVVAYYDGTDLTMSTVGGITTDRNDKAYVAFDDGEVIGVLVIKVD